MKQLVCYLTHKIDDFVLDQYRKLKTALNSDEYDVVMIFNSFKMSAEEIELPSEIDHFHIQDCEQLTTYKQQGFKFFMDFNSPKFLKPDMHKFFSGTYALFSYLDSIDYSEYDFVYYMEFDVYYNGNIKEMFDDFATNLKDYDMLTSKIRTYFQSTNWWWFDNNVDADIRTNREWDIPLEEWKRSVNPLTRFSTKAIDLLFKHYKTGPVKFFEFFWITVISFNGLKYGDFGGTGDYVIKGYENKYYRNISYVTAPQIRFRQIREKNKLYHPVKEYDKC